MSILFHHFIRKLQSSEKWVCICITCCNSPTAAIFYHTVVNMQTIIAGNRCMTTFGFQRRAINSTVIQMFIVDIALYIVNIQIFQFNIVQCTSVLCYHRNTCTIHLVWLVVHFPQYNRVIDNFQTFHTDIFTIVQQHSGRNIPFPCVIRRVQRSAVILEPHSSSLCINYRLGSIAIAANHNGSFTSSLNT